MGFGSKYSKKIPGKRPSAMQKHLMSLFATGGLMVKNKHMTNKPGCKSFVPEEQKVFGPK
jgi:hypothetical protein